MSASPSRPRPRPAATPVGTVDYGLIAIIALMLALSLALVLGASYATEGTYFFTRQLLWIGLGVVAGLIMTRIPYRVWRPLSVPIMLLALILLVAVLFLGKEINGARLAPSAAIFQPSEAAKLAVIMYVSAWVEARGSASDQARQGLLPFLIIMGLVTFLLVLEPSFSVAIIVLVIGVSIFFVGGGNILQMLLLAAAAAPALLLVFFRSGHAGRRIVQWLLALRSPGAIPSDTSPVWQKITILPEGLADRIASPAKRAAALERLSLRLHCRKTGFPRCAVDRDPLRCAGLPSVIGSPTSRPIGSVCSWRSGSRPGSSRRQSFTSVPTATYCPRPANLCPS